EREALEESLRISISQDIIVERENQMALAALMLFLSLIVLGGAVWLLMQQKLNPAKAAAAGAGLLFLGAIMVFIARPSFSEIDDRVAVAMKEQMPDEGEENPQAGKAEPGKYICRLNPDRSRITVSQLDEVPFEWADGGCVNGRTQYARDGGRWSRIFVPNEEQTVTISSFDPERAEYTTERYLLDLMTMTRARDIRQKYGNKACTADAQVLSDIEDMVRAIRVELPGQANERLVYECTKTE
ncbi:MAG: serine protease, partial [Pseudomonadota bacterium]